MALIRRNALDTFMQLAKKQGDVNRGTNHGPPSVSLTPKTKVECIRGILDRGDLTAHEKCTGIRLVVEADKEWTAKVKTAELQHSASARDRETVFRATAKLDAKGIIAKANLPGQSGKYNILPPKIVEAVIEAYDEMKSGRVKPDGMSGRGTTGNPVGFDPTASVKPVGFDPTSRLEPDQSSRARIESSLREDSYTLEEVSEVKEEGGANAPTPCDALAAFEAYNELAQRVGLPLARTLTPQRRKSMMARMREHGGLDAWRRALGNIERSAFLRGENDRGWRADLDFLLQASRFTKVVEGTYGNGAQAKESRVETTMRLCREIEERLDAKQNNPVKGLLS